MGGSQRAFSQRSFSSCTKSKSQALPMHYCAHKSGDAWCSALWSSVQELQPSAFGLQPLQSAKARNWAYTHMGMHRNAAGPAPVLKTPPAVLASTLADHERGRRRTLSACKIWLSCCHPVVVPPRSQSAAGGQVWVEHQRPTPLSTNGCTVSGSQAAPARSPWPAAARPASRAWPPRRRRSPRRPRPRRRSPLQPCEHVVLPASFISLIVLDERPAPQGMPPHGFLAHELHELKGHAGSVPATPGHSTGCKAAQA